MAKMHLLLGFSLSSLLVSSTCLVAVNAQITLLEVPKARALLDAVLEHVEGRPT